jgi:hypothetical protein
MSTFTAEEALEFRGTEEAELIPWRLVQYICEDHGASVESFIEECVALDCTSPTCDAGDLLAWLGY